MRIGCFESCKVQQSFIYYCYAIGHCFSLLLTNGKADGCSGRMLLAILMSGFKMVFLSSTKIGMDPYILMGRSLMVWACGCNKLTVAYTLGAMEASALNFTNVCPGVVSCQKDRITLVPLSKLTNILPPLLPGIFNTTSSPTLYFSLLLLNDNMEAAVCSSLPSLLCHPGLSM